MALALPFNLGEPILSLYHKGVDLNESYVLLASVFVIRFQNFL